MAGKRATALRVPKSFELERRIRELAEDSDNIVWTRHALERMEEREILDKDVLRVLRTGLINIHSIRPGEVAGDWVCKMTQRMKGSRDVGVITVVSSGNKLIVVTTEWEDLP